MNRAQCQIVYIDMNHYRGGQGIYVYVHTIKLKALILSIVF